MIKNGLAEGMVTRKLCVEVLDLVLTSFQTPFFSAPTVSKVQITDMLLLSTSLFSYPLPRRKKNVSIHKLFLSFPNKGGCSCGCQLSCFNEWMCKPTKICDLDDRLDFFTGSFCESGCFKVFPWPETSPHVKQ